uniref:Prolyl endopeptidase n=1 Tax=Periophthalmus magnuspinnatus TaxID=409849 RepID=A0A3B4A7X5_9GOBI
VQASLSKPSVDSWLPLFTPHPGFTIKDMDIIEDFGVLTTRTPSHHLGLTVISLNKPDVLYFMEVNTFIFTACFIGSVHSGAWKPHSLVLSAKDNKRYTDELNAVITSRLEARSKDDTPVPITLFHAARLEALKEAPMLVHVYGSYGRDLNMEFCPKKRLLLELGWALAFCHVRGGGESALYWHRQARVEGKRKSVDDLVACVQHLFSSGVSSSSLTALTARSAGAVPVGALCNLHPHLVKAVTLQAPFLDVLGTMADSDLPLTLEDREEWGDPVGNPEHRRIIATYCPLHNITPQRYPSMLLTAYSADSRAPLSGTVKYTEEIQKAVNSHFTLNQTSGKYGVSRRLGVSLSLIGIRYQLSMLQKVKRVKKKQKQNTHLVSLYSFILGLSSSSGVFLSSILSSSS